MYIFTRVEISIMAPIAFTVISFRAWLDLSRSCRWYMSVVQTHSEMGVPWQQY